MTNAPTPYADAQEGVRKREAVFDRLAARGDGVAAERDGRNGCIRPRVTANRLVDRVHTESRRAQHLGESNPEVVCVRGAGIARDHGDIRKLVVRDLGMGCTIGGRQPTDAPTGRRERNLVLQLRAPRVGMVVIRVGTRLLDEQLLTGVPDLVRIQDVVRRCEAVVEHDRFE